MPRNHPKPEPRVTEVVPDVRKLHRSVIEGVEVVDRSHVPAVGKQLPEEVGAEAARRARHECGGQSPSSTSKVVVFDVLTKVRFLGDVRTHPSGYQPRRDGTGAHNNA